MLYIFKILLFLLEVIPQSTEKNSTCKNRSSYKFWGVKLIFEILLLFIFN